MKSMKDFAAQQLSKKEMNNVKGGKEEPPQLWECHWEGGMTIITEDEFSKLIEDMYNNGNGVEAHCHMI